MKNSYLPLAAGLTAKTNSVCIGLEDGVADILDLVSPTTAELLKWWFQAEYCAMRSFNFHEGQRQAILNVIYAHEVLGVTSLRGLYEQVAADELPEGGRLLEVDQAKHRHPKYCFKMATGTGKTWVLQALLIWQLLNKLAEPGNKRFTKNFLLVAPGLIVYDRLLDAFCGKLKDGLRDFATSDITQYADLFIPGSYRETVFHFVQSNVCDKENIGTKATSGGMIAITNWHLLAEEDEEISDEDEIETPGADLDPVKVVESVLPLRPGRATGNVLEVLDRRFARGGVLDFLAGLPDLMVVNDEAHHIHELKKEGEQTEVEWQKSLSRIAETKGAQFLQLDFSATPYNQIGTGAKTRKAYFPHIAVDFDLKTAMRLGLVKSLVLDKRKEIGALPLEFKAERDAEGKPMLAEGQRVMLRAGLSKLKKLEADFAKIAPHRHPKMMVICEDTTVSPLVAQFLMGEGLSEDEVMVIDSDRKGDLKPDEWTKVRELLFDVDRHKAPRVLVSVLMLREGFDVSNICVIVPLRTTGAQILLEQTIGRGLRLMWRDHEYTDIKQENRERIRNGQEPKSLIDILSVIEHPAFQSFYDELMKEGLAGTTSDDQDGTSSIGDLISVGLVEGYKEYDFAIPFILSEDDEELTVLNIDTEKIAGFSSYTQQQLKTMLGKGDVFASHDVQSGTRFGDYRVQGGVMTAAGYNEYLSRMTTRLSQVLNQPLTSKSGGGVAKFPYLQIHTVELVKALDTYIRSKLFGELFDPLTNENWRLLLLDPLLQHIIKVFAEAILTAEVSEQISGFEVVHRWLSEVEKLPMRDSFSIPTRKCIYERQPFPAHNGGLEKAFMEWAQKDSGVQAFCKINETKHSFCRLRYLKDDGLPAMYSPDFLVKADMEIFLVETKAQKDVRMPNVQRKLKSAAAWCERINTLAVDDRMGREWHYVLLGESQFYEWRDKAASMADLLRFARVRMIGDTSTQARLGF
jgi:type III restriction enzyme